MVPLVAPKRRSSSFTPERRRSIVSLIHPQTATAVVDGGQPRVDPGFVWEVDHVVAIVVSPDRLPA